MSATREHIRAAAVAAGACERGLAWFDALPPDADLGEAFASNDAMLRGYPHWCVEKDVAIPPPTPEQVAAGLAHADLLVRKAWARRMDYTPTPEQVANGRMDKNVAVRWAWKWRVEGGAA